jgi:GAF domain-containing protein
VAIEKIQLLEAEQQHIKEITALYETTLATSSVLDTETLYQKLYQEVKDLFPLDVFSVARYDPIANTIEIAFLMENDRLMHDSIGRKVDLENSHLFGKIIQEQKVLFIKDLASDEIASNDFIYGDKKSRAWLGVPLITRGYVIGVMTVESFSPDTFNENHQRLLESIAAQAAIALDNARLLEQTHSQIERLAALHDIDLVINSSLDLRVTLNSCSIR